MFLASKIDLRQLKRLRRSAALGPCDLAHGTGGAMQPGRPRDRGPFKNLAEGVGQNAQSAM